MEPKSLRNAVFKLARENYGTEAEYLWARMPHFGVLRHHEPGKVDHSGVGRHN